MSEENREQALQKERSARPRRSERWNGTQDASAAGTEKGPESVLPQRAEKMTAPVTPPRAEEVQDAPAGQASRRGWHGLWRLPVLYALPFVALIAFAALRWGPDFRDLIQAIIKLVVRG